MKIRRNHGRLLAVGVALAMLLPAAAGAASHETRKVAEVVMEDGALLFKPLAGFARVDLVVRGGGREWTRSFEGGETPVFELEQKRGRLPDGLYHWELRAAPEVSKETRERLARAREASDRGIAVDLERLEIPSVPAPQSGSFSVVGGTILQPKEGEPEKRRPELGQRVGGDLEVEGELRVKGAKQFAALDPAGDGSTIHFAALEGPEVGTYYRGSARTENGEAVIPLPAYFAKMTEPTGLTVQLTPTSGASRLWVAEKGLGRLVVRSEDAGRVEFDFLVQGVRKGYADFDVERPAGPRQ